MKQPYLSKVWLYLAVLCIFACKKDEEVFYEPLTNINYDLGAIPYQKLSDYSFFLGEMKHHEPVSTVIPYEPISTLFTDYAQKKRFIWMPKDTNASYQADHKIFNFPIGTILIKSFYYDNVQPNNDTKLIETRLMIRKENKWIFANYIWNDSQTEAHLDSEGQTKSITWTHNGTNKSISYRIPSETECLTCHKMNDDPIPIGIKPQNLNSNYSYSGTTKNQLQHLKDVGYLTPTTPTNINTVVDWKDTNQSLSLRVRSYLDINCAHCHSENTHCSYRTLRLGFNESHDLEKLGKCQLPGESINPALIYIVYPGRPARSALHFRMNATDEAEKMPMLGRSIVHEEAVSLIEQWINTLPNDCN